MANILSSFSTCHHLPADCGRMVFWVFFSFSNHHGVKQNRLCFFKTRTVEFKAFIQRYLCLSFEFWIKVSAVSLCVSCDDFWFTAF